MINYSIIIPHKNIPDLLQRCLDSIPKRDDIQIIIVDDNSNSLEVDFDHFPGMNNPMIEVVFTKEDKGAGYARNVGLKKAIGKWILFADADDFYNENAFSLYDEYINSDYDVIYWDCNSVISSSMKPAERGRYINRNMSSFLSDGNEDLIRYRTYAPWCKMIPRSLIKDRNILFDEVLASNDVMFSTKVGHYANKIYVDKRKPYCVTVRKGSLVNSINKEIIKSRLNVGISHSKFLRRVGKRNIEPSNGYLLLKSIHCGFGTFLWVFTKMVTNRLRFCKGYVGIRKIKKILRLLNKKNYDNWEYKVYNKQ